jgi:hypothetical protein
MKKSAKLFTILLILFASAIVQANDEANQTTIEKGFECLEYEAEDCSDLSNQEIALTIMASPENIFESCVDELISRQQNDHWGNIKDTSLAIIALNHAGQETTAAEEWLISQNRTLEDLTWYLQQDSNEESECLISYNSREYTINVGEDKKIDQNAGECLSLAQSDFWLEISENCYSKKFEVQCDQAFIANLIYKDQSSSTIYVLKGTETAAAGNSIELEINTKCFGSSSCNYEATAWAAIALSEKGYNIDAYMPYLIAMAESNKEYLPNAFVYLLTNYDDYATALIQEQKLGNYWQATSTTHGKHYDTSLALLALVGSNADQVKEAKEWLKEEQGSNGCWQNNIIDTAIVLWALEGRAPLITVITEPNETETNETETNETETNETETNETAPATVTYCTDAGFYCLSSSECSSIDDLGDSYFCPSLSTTCCRNENLKTCSEYGGEECSSSEVCTGNSKVSLDVNKCCTGSCEKKPTENECESNYYTCMSECSEYQEEVSSYSCGGIGVCCKTKITSESGGSLWWIWILIILILAVLAAIGYVYREELKVYWFRIKNKFKKGDGDGKNASNFPARPGFPPKPGPSSRPGFPPIRRPSQPQPRKPYNRRDKRMDETFRKLKEMSK